MEKLTLVIINKSKCTYTRDIKNTVYQLQEDTGN